MNDFKINTVDYKATNGKIPAHNKRGDYTFQPPIIYGKRPWRIYGVSYSTAKKQLQLKAGRGGEFVLLP